MRLTSIHQASPARSAAATRRGRTTPAPNYGRPRRGRRLGRWRPTFDDGILLTTISAVLVVGPDNAGLRCGNPPSRSWGVLAARSHARRVRRLGDCEPQVCTLRDPVPETKRSRHVPPVPGSSSVIPAGHPPAGHPRAGGAVLDECREPHPDTGSCRRSAGHDPAVPAPCPVTGDPVARARVRERDAHHAVARFAADVHVCRDHVAGQRASRARGRVQGRVPLPAPVRPRCMGRRRRGHGDEGCPDCGEDCRELAHGTGILVSTGIHGIGVKPQPRYVNHPDRQLEGLAFDAIRRRKRHEREDPARCGDADATAEPPARHPNRETVSSLRKTSPI
jgi:hypothetical protein